MEENIASTSAGSHADNSTNQESTDSKSSCDVNSSRLFKKLMKLCKEVGDTKDMEIIVKRLEKNFDECSSEYRKSSKFCNLVEDKITIITKCPENKFLHLKDIKDELKVNKKKTTSKQEKKGSFLKDEKLAEKPTSATDSTKHTTQSPKQSKSEMNDITEVSSGPADKNDFISNTTQDNELSKPSSSNLDKNVDASSRKVSDLPASDVKAEKKNSKDALDKKHENDTAKTQRLIQRIEIAIAKLNYKIKELDQQEIDFDALSEDEDSAYILKSRYEDRFCQLHKQLCKLKKESATAGRQSLLSIKFSGTKYPDVNRAVEKFYNRKREFPNFPDIMKVVTTVNKEHNLNFSGERIHQVAKEAFKELGNQLKRRRQFELHEHLAGFLTQTELTEMDPAINDTDLNSKLVENKKHYQQKMEEVINVYADKQSEINEEAIMEEDAKLVESNVALEEDVSSQEDASEAETEKEIENQVEEAENLIEEDDSDEEVEEVEDDDDVEEIEDDDVEEIKQIQEMKEIEEIDEMEQSQEIEEIEGIKQSQEIEEIEEIQQSQEIEEIEEMKQIQEVEEDGNTIDDDRQKIEEKSKKINGNAESVTTTVDNTKSDVILIKSKDKNQEMVLESENLKQPEPENDATIVDIANGATNGNVTGKTEKHDSLGTEILVTDATVETEKEVDSTGVETMDSESVTVTTDGSSQGKDEFTLPILTDEDMAEDKNPCETWMDPLCMEVDEVSENESDSDASDETPQATSVEREESEEHLLLKKKFQVSNIEIKCLSEHDLKTKDFSIAEEECEKGSQDKSSSQNVECAKEDLLSSDNEDGNDRAHEVECCLVEQNSFAAIETNLKELNATQETVSATCRELVPAENSKDPMVKIVEEDIYIASSSGSIFLSPEKKMTVVQIFNEAKNNEASKRNACQKMMEFSPSTVDESSEEAKLVKSSMTPTSVTEKNSVFIVSSCGSTFVVPMKKTENLSNKSESNTLSESSCKKADGVDKYKNVIKDCIIKIAKCDDLVSKHERRRRKRLKVQTISLSSSSSCESDASMSDSWKVSSARRKRRNSGSSDSDFDPHKSVSQKKKKKRRNSRNQLRAVQLFQDKKFAYDSDDIVVLDEVPPRKKGSEEIVVEVDTNSLLEMMNPGPSRSNVQYSAQNYPKQRGNISITPIQNIQNVQKPIRHLVPRLPVTRHTAVRFPSVLNNTRFNSVRRPTVQIKRPGTINYSPPTLASQNYRQNLTTYRQVRPTFQQTMSQTRTLPRGGMVQQQRSFQTNARQMNGSNGNILQKQSFATYQMRHTAPAQTTTSIMNNRNVQVVTKTVTQTVKTVVQQQRISQQTISTAPNRNRPAVNFRGKPVLMQRNKPSNVQKINADVITID